MSDCNLLCRVVPSWSGLDELGVNRFIFEAWLISIRRKISLGRLKEAFIIALWEIGLVMGSA